MSCSPHCSIVRSLYKKALRTSFDYLALDRKHYRQTCITIRQRFESNRDVQDPVKIRELIALTDTILEDVKHKEPYIPCHEYGGTAYQTDIEPSPRYVAGSAETLDGDQIEERLDKKEFKFPL